VRPCCTANVADGCGFIFPLEHEHNSIVNFGENLHPCLKGRWVQFKSAVEVSQHKITATNTDFLQRLLTLLL
jgi:hypothetical protein